MNGICHILREEEEDQQLNEMMQRLGENLSLLSFLSCSESRFDILTVNILSKCLFFFFFDAGLSKFKNKRKSSFSRLFRRRSKKASMG